MVFRRTRRFRPRRLLKKRMYKRKAYKRIGGKSHTFTETFVPNTNPTISTNTGYLFTTNMNQLPATQLGSYANLYNQYCIRKLQVILVPRYDTADINTAAAGPGYYLNQYAYSITDTPDIVAPTTMLDVLEDNGCKVKTMTNKPIKITCRPRPFMDVINSATQSAVAFKTAKLQWFNFSNSDTFAPTQGQGVTHGGIALYLQNNAGLANVVSADVYYKVTFSVRDPK